jgi:hypothetical protein
VLAPVTLPSLGKVQAGRITRWREACVP